MKQTFKYRKPRWHLIAPISRAMTSRLILFNEIACSMQFWDKDHVLQLIIWPHTDWMLNAWMPKNPSVQKQSEQQGNLICGERRFVTRAVSRRLPAASIGYEAMCGICGEQSGTEAGFLQVHRCHCQLFISTVSQVIIHHSQLMQ
jgi:hypothetical protein